MRLVTHQEKVQHRGILRLHHLTDLHCGRPDFAEDELRERIELIRLDSQSRWTFGGDAGELIRHNDRRYLPSSIAPRYRQATDLRAATREHVFELLEPIKGKCWGWCDGNHERHYDREYGGVFGVEACCDLGIENRYLGYRGFIKVQVETGSRKANLPVLIDIQHGWQQGRLKGAPLVQAERELGTTEADVVLRGHNHQPGGWVFQTLGVSGGGKGQIVTRQRSLVNGGSWTHGFLERGAVNKAKLSEIEVDLWTETKGYRSEPVGGPVLVLRFLQGHSTTADETHPAPNRKAAGIEHTIVSGRIDQDTIGVG